MEVPGAKPGGGTTTSNDGKAIFTSGAARRVTRSPTNSSNGTIGPNLDQAEAAEVVVVDRVTKRARRRCRRSRAS